MVLRFLRHFPRIDVNTPATMAFRREISNTFRRFIGATEI
jgi:hypothetical protein